nr:MAG TPA: hypothetical protein [Caudoviricetes sp.]
MHLRPIADHGCVRDDYRVIVRRHVERNRYETLRLGGEASEVIAAAAQHIRAVIPAGDATHNIQCKRREGSLDALRNHGRRPRDAGHVRGGGEARRRDGPARSAGGVRGPHGVGGLRDRHHPGMGARAKGGHGAGRGPHARADPGLEALGRRRAQGARALSPLGGRAQLRRGRPRDLPGEALQGAQGAPQCRQRATLRRPVALRRRAPVDGHRGPRVGGRQVLLQGRPRHQVRTDLRVADGRQHA